jgi:hypothetical protein
MATPTSFWQDFLETRLALRKAERFSLLTVERRRGEHQWLKRARKFELVAVFAAA